MWSKWQRIQDYISEKNSKRYNKILIDSSINFKKITKKKKQEDFIKENGILKQKPTITFGTEEFNKKYEEWNSKLGNRAEQMEERTSDFEDKNLKLMQMEE